jgi:hypothetical protein
VKGIEQLHHLKIAHHHHHHLLLPFQRLQDLRLHLLKRLQEPLLSLTIDEIEEVAEEEGGEDEEGKIKINKVAMKNSKVTFLVVNIWRSIIIRWRSKMIGIWSEPSASASTSSTSPSSPNATKPASLRHHHPWRKKRIKSSTWWNSLRKTTTAKEASIWRVKQRMARANKITT